MNAQVYEHTDGQMYAINQINFTIGFVCDLWNGWEIKSGFDAFKSFH